ncbi:MAG: hypothetical protein IPK26_03920 [Planctomycetes bacterium]|nr:hypothetical protein [Planctomycetota bacterium]
MATDTLGAAHQLRSNDLVYANSTGLTYAFSAASTIAWDGVAWTQVAPSNGGLDLTWARSIVYDPVRDTLVAVRSRFASRQAECIEVDVQSSPLTFSAPAPVTFGGSTPHALYCCLAYDPTRRRIVAVSGQGFLVGHALYSWYLPSNATNWDFVQWHHAVATSPTDRKYTDMAYHHATSSCVLFGGWNGLDHLNDTWSFNGLSWTNHGNSAVVATRIQPALCATGILGTVLFGGGKFSGPYYNDMFAWTGSTWSAASTVGPLPSPRRGHDMVFDSARTRLVMYGGYDGTSLSDTWEAGLTISGWQWTQLATSGSPGPRNSHRMAYDQLRQKVVLFGGAGPTGQRLGDTWDLSVSAGGAVWTQRIVQHNPTPRVNAMMDYDPARGVVVMCGGQSTTGNLDDLWEFKGDDWASRDFANYFPVAREGAGFTYAPNLRRFVLQGGEGPSGYLTETSYYNSINDTLGPGAANGGWPIRCLQHAVAGEVTRFGFRSPMGLGWMIVYPHPAPTIAMSHDFGCGPSYFYGLNALVADAHGPEGTIAFTIPTWMAGAGFVIQGLTHDGSCFRATNPMAVTVQAY